MDSTDNIIGVEGIGAGDKKNKNITREMALRGEISRNPAVMSLWALENPTEKEMYELVRTQYVHKYGENYLYYMLENYFLLTMLKKPSFDYPKEVKLTRWNEIVKDPKRKLINI